MAELSDWNAGTDGELLRPAKPGEDVMQAALFENIISEIEDYAIFMLDVDGKITTWNKGAERIKGYSADEIIGQHFSQFYKQEDKDAGLPEKLLEKARVDGRAEHEGWRVGKHEDTFWANVVISAITNDAGQHTGYIKVTRDLSERMAAEKVINEYEFDLKEQAKKSEMLRDMYMTFVSEAEDYSIIMLNENGAIIDWNKAAERLKGYSFEEVHGKHFGIFYTPEDMQGLLPEKILVKAKREGRTENEGWRIRKDGTKFWANVVITAVRDNSGEVKGYIKITRDLTKKMLAEKAAAKYTAELELEISKVKQRDELLAKTYRKLNTSTNVRSRFVKSATNDMQVPLKNILEAANRLSNKQGQIINDNDLLDVQRIIVSASAAKKTIQDVALLSVLLENSVNLEASQFDINQLVKDIIEHKPGGELLKHNIEYKCMGQKDLYLPAPLVHYAVENSVLNALKFSPEESSIVISASEDGDNIVLNIEDSGPGIPAEEQALLFESFYRGSNIKDITEGTGLSLYLAKNFMIMMGGDITYKPKEDNKGSIFTITLPRKTKAA